MKPAKVIGLLLLLFGLYLALTGGINEPSKPVVPAPIEVKGLHVVFLEDFDKRPQLPKEQLSLFTSAALAKWLDENAVAWRKIKTRDEMDTEPDWVRIAVERGKKSSTLPWMGAYGVSSWSEGPAPKNVQEAITILSVVKAKIIK